VLVLLATFNGAQWLQEQLQSVLTQSGVEVSLLIADDASADDTQPLIDGWAARDARVRHLPFGPGTGSAGANFRRLIAAADVGHHTHVAFCDQDDRWKPDKLAAACIRLRSSGASLYSSATRACWADGRTRTLRQTSRPTCADYYFEGAGQGCTFVLDRAFFLRVQAFVQAHMHQLVRMHYHDWMVYALSRCWGLAWFYDDEARLDYRQHGGNDTGARGSLGSLHRRTQLIRSGWYANQVKEMLSLCRMAVSDDAQERKVQALMDSATRSLSGRLAWCWFLLMHSRRRVRDRVTLALYAAMACL
jgi:rhamnosyltransferase